MRAVVGNFVVDASVAVKWLFDEEGSDTALALQSADLAAPALLRIEASNVLRTLVAKQAVSDVQARSLFDFFQTAPVTIVDQNDELEKRALELALELQHPVYDCVYLALTERMGRMLVTADRRFLAGLANSSHAGLAISLEDL